MPPDHHNLTHKSWYKSWREHDERQGRLPFPDAKTSAEVVDAASAAAWRTIVQFWKDTAAYEEDERMEMLFDLVAEIMSPKAC